MLSLLKARRFENWWYMTGTPTFFMDDLQRERLFSIDLHQTVASGALLELFDVDSFDIKALLFQAGYLTIKGFKEEGNERTYYLDYPNREVRESLHRSLLDDMLPEQNATNIIRRAELREYLASGNFGKLKELLQSVFAGIPYSWHTRGNLADYEAYFASVVYSYFLGAEVDFRVENITNRERVDLSVETEETVYIFEFKVLRKGDEGSAMAQLKKKKYAEKYKILGKKIYLVGTEFCREERSLARFDIKRV